MSVEPMQQIAGISTQRWTPAPTVPTGTGQRAAYASVLKPTIDRLLAALLLIILVPVMSAVAMLVLLAMGRPVLFRQDRVGRGGDVFALLKFRTMRPDRRSQRLPYENEDRRRYHKSGVDPRHTAVGRLLRRSSLDELPQLLHVLRGDMSLVGPRPELTHVVEAYEAWQHDRHAVKPGVTGLWQVSARGDGPMHEYVHIDIEYIQSMSLVNDMKILARTVPAALGRKGGA